MKFSGKFLIKFEPLKDSDTGYRIPDTGYRIPDTGYRILHISVEKRRTGSDIQIRIMAKLYNSYNSITHEMYTVYRIPYTLYGVFEHKSIGP